MKEVFKTILGIITSPEIIRIFDDNNDGSVSWDELTNATKKEWIKAISMIGGDLFMKYGWLLITLL